MKKEIIVCDSCNKNEKVAECSICGSDICDKCGIRFTDFDDCKIYFCQKCSTKISSIFQNKVPSKRIEKTLIKALISEMALGEL